MATAPVPLTQAARYWMPTLTALRSPASVLPPGVWSTDSSCCGAHLDLVALARYLVRVRAQHGVEDLAADLHQIGMRNPGTVEPVAGLPRLVVAHLGQRDLVDGRVAAAGDEGRHPADGVRAAPVAGLDEQLGVGAQERRGHRDRVAVGKDEPPAEVLDDAEHVVPAARVEARRVLAQLVKNLVHLEGGRDGLDEHRGAQPAPRQVKGVLGEAEHVVPQPSLKMAFHLGQVEERASPLGAVEGVEAEVDQARREPILAHEQVFLAQMPAARPEHDGWPLGIRVQLVMLALRAGVGDRPGDRVAQVQLPVDDVFPQRRVGVLVVGQPHLAPRSSAR